MSRVFFNRGLVNSGPALPVVRAPSPISPPPAGAAPEPVPGPKRGVSSDGQVGHQDLSSCLRAQQHGDKEDGQADHRGDENRTRKGNVLGGCV
jgi:hypothetical protein